MERLFEAGALEVYTVAVDMKKSRLGIMLCVICGEAIRDDIIHLIFKHTTSLGVRENISNRYTLQRRTESIKTVWGEIWVKYSEGYGVVKEKYEYEDLARIARDNELSINEVIRMIMFTMRRRNENCGYLLEYSCLI